MSIVYFAEFSQPGDNGEILPSLSKLRCLLTPVYFSKSFSSSHVAYITTTQRRN